MDWFMLQVYTGYEKRAKKLIEEELKIKELQDKVDQIFIPVENVVRIRKSKKVVLEKNFSPAYVFIHMEDSKGDAPVFNTDMCSNYLHIWKKETCKIKRG